MKNNDEYAVNTLNFLVNLGNFFLKSFVFMVVWNWFAVRIFEANSLQFAQSMGLLLLLVFVKSAAVDSKRFKEMTADEKLSNTLTMTGVYFTLWGIAAIVQLFV